MLVLVLGAACTTVGISLGTLSTAPIESLWRLPQPAPRAPDLYVAGILIQS
jgi:hypothetical protein